MQSKIHVLRFRAKNGDIFEAIRNGTKRVETRAASKKFRGIRAGDTLKLVCGKQSFEKKVKRVHLFRTIESLLRRYSVKAINPNVDSKEELVRLYYSFRGYRQAIKRYGLIAMELK
ncbi:MAG: hypothetical protein A2934_00370 [Candidatus Sungbacteria bacterium RIFCSPLOWO2_01_FULL_47_10]|uniref:ASCH domain-containing protein n=1 Tax=Candidatus Sungbacteria bacterium RIFCSPLOWO2_01_FULL_47_10 TaxID=1802276 RepID=A0A1G2KYA5_9BACT|nr:MAG: hypothetical protein A2934_00370 [Candidatus Sungbacteria bacterium RIFCSPLOWO2_01_FULL_47_10]